MNRRCKNCYYYEICESKSVCDDYTPLIEHDDEQHILNAVESGREEFYREWFGYIAQYEN